MSRLRRSQAVPATFISALAVVCLTGCARQYATTERRTCVDQNGRVLPDSYCNSSSYNSGIYRYPRYIYGGTYDQNSGMMRNFRSSPSPNANVVDSRGTVIRRGIGSAGRGFGGFGLG
ncbi:MAG: hypothetical protein SFX74_05375 [Fimbriimonadaceae bacterium]|nr:hypothetical protein [Fimbriimonadaceae bacterium]